MNEHFLALKNKYNNEQDLLKKKVNNLESENKKEDMANKQRMQRIEVLKREYEETQQKFNDFKEAKQRELRDIETKLFTEQHTKDVLTQERADLLAKLTNLKADNQNMARDITKDKYHNNRDEVEKKRRKDMENVQEDINKTNIKIEAEQAILEEEIERNEDVHLLKKEKEITLNLNKDHNKIKTDITVAENRIKDLMTRREILENSIRDILKDKRKVDKYNMELEDMISGRNVTEEMTKRRHKNEERKMRIKYEKNLDNLKINGEILMDKTTHEEVNSKKVLDEKLKLEQELIDLKEKLQMLTD